MEPIAHIPLYKTTDYSVFKSLNGNRDLSKVNIVRLAKQIDRNPTYTKLSPIKVNEKMQVFDGQHRVEAYRRHELATGETPEVYFTIHEGAGLNEARDLNAGSKPWAPIDYAHMYAESGHKHYQAYLEFLFEFDFMRHEVAASYLAPNTPYDLDEFRRGNFKVEDIERARKLARQLTEIGPLTQYGNQWKNRLFALTFLEIASGALYDHDRMLANCQQYGDHVKNVEYDRYERPQLNSALARALLSVYNKRA